MDIKYTKGTLSKLEQLFEESRYRVRYEKGQFHSGYCIMEDKKIAVINRFLDLEGRINALIDIVPSVKIPYKDLSGEMQKFYTQVLQPLLPDNAQQMELSFEQNPE